MFFKGVFMFNNFKKVRDARKKIKQRDLSLFKTNEEGDLVYEFKLGKGEIYSPYATTNNPIINEDVVAHIDDVCDCLSTKDSVEFRILTPKDHSASKQNIEEALDHHYTKKLIQSKKQYRTQLKHGLILFLIGLAIFAIYYGLRVLFDANSVVSFLEIVDIASWVFVWEAVDVIFLGMSVHKSEQTRFSKIVNAKITVITQQEETINIRIDNDIIQKEIEQTQQKLKSAPRV